MALLKAEARIPFWMPAGRKNLNVLMFQMNAINTLRVCIGTKSPTKRQRTEAGVLTARMNKRKNWPIGLAGLWSFDRVCTYMAGKNDQLFSLFFLQSPFCPTSFLNQSLLLDYVNKELPQGNRFLLCGRNYRPMTEARPQRAAWVGNGTLHWSKSMTFG